MVESRFGFRAATAAPAACVGYRLGNFCRWPDPDRSRVDLLGHTLMSLSTLFAAPAIAGGTAARGARFWPTASGALAPFLLLQAAWPWLIHVGAVITLLLTTLFPALTVKHAKSP